MVRTGFLQCVVMVFGIIALDPQLTTGKEFMDNRRAFEKILLRDRLWTSPGRPRWVAIFEVFSGSGWPNIVTVSFGFVKVPESATTTDDATGSDAIANEQCSEENNAYDGVVSKTSRPIAPTGHTVEQGSGSPCFQDDSVDQLGKSSDCPDCLGVEGEPLSTCARHPKRSQNKEDPAKPKSANIHLPDVSDTGKESLRKRCLQCCDKKGKGNVSREVPDDGRGANKRPNKEEQGVKPSDKGDGNDTRWCSGRIMRRNTHGQRSEGLNTNIEEDAISNTEDTKNISKERRGIGGIKNKGEHGNSLDAGMFWRAGMHQGKIITGPVHRGGNWGLDPNVVDDGISDEEDMYTASRDHGSSASVAYDPRHAAFPEYSGRIERVLSLGSWSNPHRCITSEAAEAGLFYPGTGENLKCHHCGVSIRPLDRSSDAWIEHARANPRCGFVRSTKGAVFVEMAAELDDGSDVDDSELERGLQMMEVGETGRNQDIHGPSERPGSMSTDAMIRSGPSAAENRGATSNPSQAPGLQRAIPRRTRPVPSLPESGRPTQARRRPRVPKRQVQAREVRARLDMEWAQELISIGYSPDLIGAVIAEQLIYEGDDFRSFREILNATIKAADMGDDYPVRHYALGLSQNRTGSGGADAGSDSRGLPPPAQGETATARPVTTFPPTQRAPGSNSVMVLSAGASSWSDTTQSAGYKEALVGTPAPGNQSAALAEENRQLRDRKNCKICFERDANMVFIPCGHLAVCQNCCSRVHECPFCRRPIDGVLKAYLS